MANTNITISPLKVTPLSEQEVAATGYNVKFRVASTDILYGTGASDTVTMAFGSTPTFWYIDKAGVRVPVAFAGITALTLTVGTTTTTNSLITSTSLLAQQWIPQAAGVVVQTNLTATAAQTLQAVFTAAGTGGPAALTAGNLDVYLRVVDVGVAGARTLP